MNQLGSRVRRQLSKHQIAIFAISDTGPNLDQFMIMQSPVELADDAIGQAALADQHERVQGVSQASQVFFLTIRECHALIIDLHPGNAA